MNRLFDISFRSSLLRNSLIQFIWWVVFFPGFYSGDSFGAVAMAKSGEFTNSGTASWALYVRVFSFFGKAFPLLTLISGLLLIYGSTRLAYAMFHNKIASISSFALTLTPVVAGMGITLWHDIPLTSGFLLVVAFFITQVKDSAAVKHSSTFSLIPGSVLISFKPNGLPTLVVFAAIYCVYLAIKSSKSNSNGPTVKQTAKFAGAAIALTAVITFLGSNVIIGMSPINNYYAQEWMRNDISCYADTPAGAGFVEKQIPGIGTTETWRSSTACVFLNKAAITSEEKIAAEKYVPSAWIKLLKTDPVFIVKTHLDRNAYLVPIPISGVPTEPFLHSIIEFKDQGIEWAFPQVAEKARIIMRIWNAGRGLTGWAGIWALVLIVLAIWRKQKGLAPAIVMCIAMIGILFVVAPIPDGRYALFVLIAGQLALLGNIVEWAQTGSNRRPTD